jgi:hypothetical protein
MQMCYFVSINMWNLEHRGHVEEKRRLAQAAEEMKEEVGTTSRSCCFAFDRLLHPRSSKRWQMILADREVAVTEVTGKCTEVFHL